MERIAFSEESIAGVCLLIISRFSTSGQLFTGSQGLSRFIQKNERRTSGASSVLKRFNECRMPSISQYMKILRFFLNMQSDDH